jgi:hypothetical protein
MDMQTTTETNIDPASFNVPFEPVIDLNSGEIITNAWDFITYVYGYDNDMTNFRLEEITEQTVPEGYDYPIYRVVCDYTLKGKDGWVIEETWRGYSIAIENTLDEAWKLVNNQGSCKYGIWETANELKNTLVEYKNEGDEFLTPIRLRLKQLEDAIKILDEKK